MSHVAWSVRHLLGPQRLHEARPGRPDETRGCRRETETETEIDRGNRGPDDHR